MTIYHPHKSRVGLFTRISLLLILCLLPTALLGKTPRLYRKADPKTRTATSYQLRYRMAGAVGFLNRDDKVRDFRFDRPVITGGTVAVEFLPTGRWKCMQQWNNASIGLAFSVFDLGQQRYLGQVFTPHAYLNVPLVRQSRVTFGLRPGLGVAFVNRTYANTVPAEYKWQAYQIEGKPIANRSIGSIANVFLSGGLYLDVNLVEGWDFTFSGGWQHLSNGSIMTPNGGYNMFNVEAGIAYTPDRKTNGFHYYRPDPDVPSKLHDGVTKKWGIDFTLGAGARSVYYRDRDWFPTASFSLAAYWQPYSIFRIGLGADLYYDGAYAAIYKDFASEQTKHITYYGKTYLNASKVTNCLRAGISLQPEFVFGNLTFGYHIGFYLYDPVKNLEPFADVKNNGGKPLNRGIFYAYNPAKSSNYQDGWCYQKLILRYYCSRHFFLHVGLKLHIFKAEFIDAGLGFRI
ncbi:MAG: acyloxyacyl hydrolase [Paludibacteraceae bacterium]|nr:acyloxyacyl hydrolase [Paludibacteraceae bacterium]